MSEPRPDGHVLIAFVHNATTSSSAVSFLPTQQQQQQQQATSNVATGGAALPAVSTFVSHYEVMLPVLFIIFFMLVLFMAYAFANLDYKRRLKKLCCCCHFSWRSGLTWQLDGHGRERRSSSSSRHRRQRQRAGLGSAGIINAGQLNAFNGYDMYTGMASGGGGGRVTVRTKTMTDRRSVGCPVAIRPFNPHHRYSQYEYVPYQQAQQATLLPQLAPPPPPLPLPLHFDEHQQQQQNNNNNYYYEESNSGYYRLRRDVFRKSERVANFHFNPHAIEPVASANAATMMMADADRQPHPATRIMLAMQGRYTINKMYQSTDTTGGGAGGAELSSGYLIDDLGGNEQMEPVAATTTTTTTAAATHAALRIENELKNGGGGRLLAATMERRSYSSSQLTEATVGGGYGGGVVVAPPVALKRLSKRRNDLTRTSQATTSSSECDAVGGGHTTRPGKMRLIGKMHSVKRVLSAADHRRRHNRATSMVYTDEQKYPQHHHHHPYYNNNNNQRQRRTMGCEVFDAQHHDQFTIHDSYQVRCSK